MAFVSFLQSSTDQEPWDQEKFEQLLVEWIVACDQPFDEVEKPEFIDLMCYGRHGVPNFSLPKREGIRRRIMKLGEETVEEVRTFFVVCIVSFLA